MKSISPYYATFGRDMQFGLNSTTIPKEILNKLSDEEQLQQVLKEKEINLINQNQGEKSSHVENNDVEHFENVEHVEQVEHVEHFEHFEPTETIEYVEPNVVIDLEPESIDNIIEVNVEKKKRGRKRKERVPEVEQDHLVEERPAKMSNVETNAMKIADVQETCIRNLRSAAEKMAQQHIHKLGEAKVGDTVQVPVPDVDRGPGDLLNIIAYITKINQQHMTYQLATKYGIIKGNFSRNMFHICKQKLLTPESLDLSVEKTLRELNALHSITGGQGFLKCNCTGKCERNCKCKQNGVYCNSRCHKGGTNTQCTRKN